MDTAATAVGTAGTVTIPLRASVSSWRVSPLSVRSWSSSSLICPFRDLSIWETRDYNDTAVFGAVNAIGNGMRESRQNDMIYQERVELGAAREREAEMASRIRQLEMMQMQQAGGGGQQPQIIIAQPPVMQVAPAK